MRLIFWVTALAVLSLAWAKNSTTKLKPKRQLENIRTPQNLQYSLVLPHSRVASFRSLNSNRRISNASPRGKLPPYAVQMEPVVQYSQKDPLYDPNHENIDEVVNKNELYAQAKVLNIGDQGVESIYAPHYGSLPTAPLYSHEPHPQYYEAPEPIIEIIIKESNETLPAPPSPPVQKKKKEPVQVFYVKYSKDPHSHDKVIYEKPIPAVTPPTNNEDEAHNHYEEYVTVTPEPYYVQPQTTTLRAIIKPDSEVFHSDSSVKVTFGSESDHHNQYSDRREGHGNHEDHEETAPRPAIAYPQQVPNHPPLERSAHPQPQPQPQIHKYLESPPRAQIQSNHPTQQTYRQIQSPQPHAQSRIQFQTPFLANEQQLPRQTSPNLFRGQINRQNPFSNPITSFPGPIAHFPNSPPTIPGPIGASFPTSQPRPSNPPSFHPRPNSQPPFAPRPSFGGPPRTAFHSGPQRPFHQPPQPQPFFDEAKYLQENYHTITTEQIDQPKEQRPSQNFNFIPKGSPSPNPQFQDNLRPQQLIPVTQLLPQQRPHQQFVDNARNKPSFAAAPSRSPFYNLKPSPPHIEEPRIPFQSQSNQQFSFHQEVQSITRPSIEVQPQQHRFPGPISASPSTIPQTQFLPQPSSPPQFHFQPQPSRTPERPDHFQPHSPSERPQFQHFNSNPSERPLHQSNFQDQANLQHQQNVGQFVPNGGELVAAIPKYEQHITVTGSSTDYSGLGGASPTGAPSRNEQQYRQQQEQQHHQQLQHQQQQQLQQKHRQEQQQQDQQRQQYLDAEQEQVRLQLAQNVQKQQEEIQRLQSQLIQAQHQQQRQQHQQQQQQQQQQQHQQQQQQQQQQLQQQHQQQQLQHQQKQYELNYRQLQQEYHQQQSESTSPEPQYNQEQQRPSNYRPTYAPSSASPPYYQSTSRTIEIKPTTPKYVSSTANSISTAPEGRKEQKKNKPAFELPDEVPDDLRQQLLSSGILDNADISVLDYDKVGDTPLDALPPDQLANFFSAGGGQAIASSEHRPIVVAPNGEQIQSRIDDDADDDQDIAASENVATYAVAPPHDKQAVEMKVVHFDPSTSEGKKIPENYVKEDATRLEPVALNDKKYNRYLPLKVSGNQFPLPDILKGRKVTSVVVLAPVETEAINSERPRVERAATNNLKGIKFIAGDSLQDLLKNPTTENFERWLKTEKNTATDLQSVVLLVTGSDDSSEDREIYMYDISSGNVNKLDGELSNAFVEAAENNSLSKDIEKLAIEGEGVPENFEKNDKVEETVPENLEKDDESGAEEDSDSEAEGSVNVPFLVGLSGLSIDQDNSNHVSISTGYSKTKLGRSLRKH